MATTEKSSSRDDSSNSTFRLAQYMSSSGPAIQVILALSVAHRYNDIISARDVLFCALYPAYLLLANRYRFASNLPLRLRPDQHPHSASTVMKHFMDGDDEPWFKRYMVFAATLGLILPLLTVVYMPVREVAVLAVPPLFVLWCQIIGESVVMFKPNVHRFITLLVPVGFSAYRMNLLIEWFRSSVALYMQHVLVGWYVGSGSFDPNAASAAQLAEISSAAPVWYTLGVILSGANLLFWSYNLFVTLLLKVVPQYLSSEKCESPQMRVIWLPFIGEPSKEK